VAKDKLTDYSATNASNTDVGGINIDEGMLPSAVNNSIRELMTHQKEAFGSGTPMFVDQTNNRVGVGNSAPSTALEVDADGATVLTVDRASSHGDIVEVQKDGTRFGALGSQSSGFYIDGESGHSGLRFANGAVTPREDLADADNSNDLGASNNRWANLYLGGNLFIGGTGSANALSDYELGTFTPVFSSGLTSGGYATQAGTYVKVSAMVICSIFLRANSGTEDSNHIRIGGLPFAFTSATDHAYGAFFTYNAGFWTSDANTQWLAFQSDTNMGFYKQSDGGVIAGTNSNVAANLNADCRLTVVYRTDS
tara:strand:+ start:53 stop:982 length:930 start_codon:yes stop_codon:yes gene_type:complete